MYEQYVNSDEQCMNSDFCLYTMNSSEITVHVQEKKKKKKESKTWNWKRNNKLNPNTNNIALIYHWTGAGYSYPRRGVCPSKYTNSHHSVLCKSFSQVTPRSFSSSLSLSLSLSLCAISFHKSKVPNPNL